MKKYLLLLAIVFSGISSKAQIPTVQDCLGAIQIFDSVIVVPNSFLGEGNYPNEINPSFSCLNQGEKNDVWLYFDVCNDGQLGFSVEPLGNDDYDWAVFDLTNATCSNIYTNPGLEISCNFSGVVGPTGPNGLPGASNEPLLNVITGQRLLINISNFSTTQTGFEIHFINPGLKCNGGVIQGKVFLDLDSNCIQTINENVIPNRLVHLNNSIFYTTTASNGEYKLQALPGNYDVSVINPNYTNVLCPSTGIYSLVINSISDSLLNNDFALTTPANICDLKCDLVSTAFRINDTTQVKFNVINHGTTMQNAVIKFSYDTLLNFISASEPIDSIVGYDVWLHIDSLNYFDSRKITFELFCPITVPLSHPLTFTGLVIPGDPDTITSDNSDTVFTQTMYSYDPNEIEVNPIGIGIQHLINANQKLEYTIHFQNTGTAEAENIMIDNPIDPDLDWATLDLISSSHNYEIKIINNQILRFNFFNINLPDSFHNEPGSHGYVEYTIYPKQKFFARSNN